jgi:hypothetical protein
MFLLHMLPVHMHLTAMQASSEATNGRGLCGRAIACMDLLLHCKRMAKGNTAEGADFGMHTDKALEEGWRPKLKGT